MTLTLAPQIRHDRAETMHPGLPMPVLRPGMRVQVVAPASPFPQEDFERGIARLRQRYEVRHDLGITERAGYLAGSDERRARELLAALEDDQVHAIVAARGGYGATRLLPALPVASVARQPKLLVGFSDVSALHALWARAGLGSIHGAMAAGLGRMPEPQLARWFAAVEGAPPPALRGLTAIAEGRARGRLCGGNLAVLTALIGTPYLPDLDGCVLFLEDVGERPYRVDRMLTTWEQAGLLALPSAIVLGAFAEAAPGSDGVRVEEVLAERLGRRGIPVLAGVPSGHVDDNLELPLGALADVDAAAGTLSFEVDRA
jgi:muramoyltetrapeptide carboxypeptidase